MNVKTLVVVPLVCALSSAPLAIGQTTGGSAPAAASAESRTDDKAIQNLLAAAQRLRESIQAMAQAPAGAKRTEAVKQGNDALLEVQAAMAGLPPDLLLANAKESDYQTAMDKLKKSAQRLRDSSQALAKETDSKKRNQSIRQINEALLEVQQAMIYIPVSAKK